MSDNLDIIKRFKEGDFVKIELKTGEIGCGTIKSISEREVALIATNYYMDYNAIVEFIEILNMSKVVELKYPNGPVGTVVSYNSKLSAPTLTYGEEYICQKIDKDFFYLIDDNHQVMPFSRSGLFWGVKQDSYNYILHNLLFPIEIVRYIGSDKNEEFYYGKIYNIYSFDEEHYLVILGNSMGVRKHYSLDILAKFISDVDINLGLEKRIKKYLYKNQMLQL